MILYFDTSALIKRYIREQDSSLVRQWIEEADLVGCNLIARAEMAAAIRRLWLMKELGAETAFVILTAFRRHWPAYIRLPVTETTAARADELAWQFGLRGYDAVHLASAVLWQEALGERVTLATYDRPLWQAARKAGLATLPEAAASA